MVFMMVYLTKISITMDNEQKQNKLIVLNKSTIEMTKYDVNLE
jgi:hypothetical protein